MLTDSLGWQLRCTECGQGWPAAEVRYRCACGGLLEVHHHAPVPLDTATIDLRRMSRRVEDRSGVWRFREWILPLPAQALVTAPEGNTGHYRSETIARWTGQHATTFKHEGENPTGSFKDRGMTVALSAARGLGMKAVACASTGNTSASMASYAARAGMKAFVFIPAGNVALGKLAQAMAYGATTLRIPGDFDDAMRLVQEVCLERGIYLVNSINPFRIEGQKAIGFEILEDLEWRVPEWIVLPGGNLGNSSALWKGLQELHALGVINRLPRIAVVQARGANPLYRAWSEGHRQVQPMRAETLASAIRIGDPVSWKKCIRGLEATDGVVVDVSDAEILEAKGVVDRAGIGAEPASCASVAGLRTLVKHGIIGPEARVVAILTGHVLKDPDVIVRYHEGTLGSPDAAFRNPVVDTDGTLIDVLRHLPEAGA
jgi:threonine synthase